MEENSLKNSALLVIDMQRYFLEKGAPAYLGQPDSLLKNVKTLVSAFRNTRLPVVFTRHAHSIDSMSGEMSRWWHGELPMENDPYSELVKELNPADDEIFMTKTKYSAFEGTSLESALRQKGVLSVTICGVMTNLCVETTARHAFMKDFRVIVALDACATKNRDYHRASLLNLSYGFARIEKTKAIIKCL
jgi:nicotinamidase-related amidase